MDIAGWTHKQASEQMPTPKSWLMHTRHVLEDMVWKKTSLTLNKSNDWTCIKKIWYKVIEYEEILFKVNEYKSSKNLK